MEAWIIESKKLVVKVGLDVIGGNVCNSLTAGVSILSCVDHFFGFQANLVNA